MNRFQQYMLNLPEDKKLEIARIFNPELTGVNKNGNKSIPTFQQKYDWVMIYLNNKISVGITFHHGFTGTGYKMKHFIEAYEKNSFKAWRFVDDPNFKRNPDEDDNEGLTRKINEYFKQNPCPKPTPQEMITYYYRD